MRKIAQAAGLTSIIGAGFLAGSLAGCNSAGSAGRHYQGTESPTQDSRRETSADEDNSSLALSLIGGAISAAALNRGDIGRAFVGKVIADQGAARAGRNRTQIDVNNYESDNSGLQPAQNAGIDWPSPINTTYSIAFRGMKDVNGDGRIQPQELIGASKTIDIGDEGKIYFGLSRNIFIDAGKGVTMHVVSADGVQDYLLHPVRGMPEGLEKEMVGRWKTATLKSKLIDGFDAPFMAFEVDAKELKESGSIGEGFVEFYKFGEVANGLGGYSVMFENTEPKTEQK